MPDLCDTCQHMNPTFGETVIRAKGLFIRQVGNNMNCLQTNIRRLDMTGGEISFCSEYKRKELLNGE